MSQKSKVADSVAIGFELDADALSVVQNAAIKVADSNFDFQDACASVAGVFRPWAQQGVLSFERWESVRLPFVESAGARALANGAIDAEGAGSDCWLRVAKHLKEFYSLEKPKSAKAEAASKAEQREKAKAKAIEVAAGRSAAEMKVEQVALYQAATPESIAQAKALEKAISVVEKFEKDESDSRMKPLVDSVNAEFKATLAWAKDGKRESDLIEMIRFLKNLRK